MEEKRLTLQVHDLEQTIKMLLLNYPEIADDEQLLEDTLEGSTDFNVVMGRLVDCARAYKANANAVSEMIDELAARQSKWDRREKVMRATMMRLMQAAGRNKVVLPQATLSLGSGRKGVAIVDDAEIPDEFCTFERKVSKTKIKQALDAGQDVPGAALKNGEEVLTIR